VTPRAGDLVVTRWGAQFRGHTLPCAVGRGGITLNKREGDGATPAGVLHLTGVVARPDRIAPWPECQAIRLGDVWSDDVTDPAYNHGFHAPDHPFGHEKMRRADPLYDLVGLTDWNWPNAVPGKGSAIFLHRWRKPRHPTEGCIAFAPHDLRFVLENLGPDSRIIVKP